MENLSNEEIILKMIEFRDDCELGNADLFARMAKASRFYNGDQWDPGTREYRERKKKFCLTIPLIKPQVNQVVGSQIQNPKDVIVVPERTGSSTGARIRSRLIKHAMDSEHSVFELTQWFNAGLASGVGFIGAFIDRHGDPKHGNLTIERLNEFECGFDSNCVTFDINSYAHGAKYFIWEPWIDKDLIHEQYPKKRTELEGSGGGGGSTNDPTGFWGWLKSGYNDVRSMIGRAMTGFHATNAETVERYKYKVSHTWWRRPKRCVVVYVEGSTELDAMTFVKDKDILDAKRLARERPDEISIEEIVVNVVCHTVRVGDVLLENNEDELNGVTRYPIGVYSAYFSNGYRSGMVEDMIGTQEEINWSHSQNLQVIRHLSTYHWKIAKDESGKQADWLRANADEDNLVIDESKFGNKVEKSMPRPNVGGLERFAEIAKENLKLVSNVRTEDPSFDSKNMSGKAIALKQLNSQTGQASVFQNFDYALNMFGGLVDEILVANEVYSDDEIRAIIEDDDLLDMELMSQAKEQVTSMLEKAGVELPEPPQMMNPNPAPEEVAGFQRQMMVFNKMNQGIEALARPIAEEMLMAEIKNLRKGRYTTKVTLSPYAPTMRLAEQAEYRELNQELIASNYPPLSRKRLIQASDIKDKDEILQEDEAMQNQMMQMAAQAPKGKVA